MKRGLALTGLVLALVYASHAQQPLVKDNRLPPSRIRCGLGGENAKPSCTLASFDRVDDKIWTWGGSKDSDDKHDNLGYVSIIRGSGTKILYSGTILDVPLDNTQVECSSVDWRVVTMARESSNILIYGPADVSEFCNSEPKALPPTTGTSHLVVVLPVTVIWAELYSHRGNLGDPLRKPAGQITAALATDNYCGGYPKGLEVDAQGKPINPKHSPPFSKETDIRPCDRYTWIKYMYHRPAGPIWNSWTQPGASAGSISYTPGIGKGPNLTGGPAGEKAPAQALTFDIQEYPSQKWGPGYIGAPVVFEKSNSATANLNSLVYGVSYDLPLAVKQWKRGKETQTWKLFFMRPPELRLQYGPEMAVSTPHDMNVTAAFSMRLPIGFNLPRQPSVLTIFPMAGLEGGNHIFTHLSEPDPVFRQVIGYDTSLRVPFVVTHAFFGDKPTTIDFSWRTRFLSYNEPFTDYVSGYPERLTTVKRSYWRGTYALPFSQLASFKVTVQHGGLPPDFDYLGFSVNVGLTLGNPGYTEH